MPTGSRERRGVWFPKHRSPAGKNQLKAVAGSSSPHTSPSGFASRAGGSGGAPWCAKAELGPVRGELRPHTGTSATERLAPNHSLAGFHCFPWAMLVSSAPSSDALTCPATSGAPLLPRVPKITSPGRSRHRFFPRGGGTSWRLLQLLPSSSLARTTKIHRSGVGTLQEFAKQKSRPHESGRSPLLAHLEARSRPWCAQRDPSCKQLSQTDLTRLSPSSCFPICPMKQTPGWKSICPPLRGCGGSKQLALPTGSSDPGIWRKPLQCVPRSQPRAMPLQTAVAAVSSWFSSSTPLSRSSPRAVTPS